MFLDQGLNFFNQARQVNAYPPALLEGNYILHLRAAYSLHSSVAEARSFSPNYTNLT